MRVPFTVMMTVLFFVLKGHAVAYNVGQDSLSNEEPITYHYIVGNDKILVPISYEQVAISVQGMTDSAILSDLQNLPLFENIADDNTKATFIPAKDRTTVLISLETEDREGYELAAKELEILIPLGYVIGVVSEYDSVVHITTSEINAQFKENIPLDDRREILDMLGLILINETKWGTLHLVINRQDSPNGGVFKKAGALYDSGLVVYAEPNFIRLLPL